MRVFSLLGKFCALPAEKLLLQYFNWTEHFTTTQVTRAQKHPVQLHAVQKSSKLSEW